MWVPTAHVAILNSITIIILVKKNGGSEVTVTTYSTLLPLWAWFITMHPNSITSLACPLIVISLGDFRNRQVALALQSTMNLSLSSLSFKSHINSMGDIGSGQTIPIREQTMFRKLTT
jgi:hypothetical protein